MKKILFALLVIALLALVACAPKEAEEPAATVVEPEPTQPKPDVVEPKTDTTTDLLEPLSSVVCKGDKISIVVTNLGKETWVLGESMKIYLNAGIDKEPGCEKTELGPGESMTCDSIDWPLVVKSPKKNIVQVIVPGERFSVEGIICEQI